MAIETVDPGNIVRTDVTFVPASGSVSIGNVTCRVVDPLDEITSLSVVAGTTNAFYAVHTVGDTAQRGAWTFRWECSSPKISVEVAVLVTSSAFGSDA